MVADSTHSSLLLSLRDLVWLSRQPRRFWFEDSDLRWSAYIHLWSALTHWLCLVFTFFFFVLCNFTFLNFRLLPFSNLEILCQVPVFRWRQEQIRVCSYLTLVKNRRCLQQFLLRWARCWPSSLCCHRFLNILSDVQILLNKRWLSAVFLLVVISFLLQHFLHPILFFLSRHLVPFILDYTLKLFVAFPWVHLKMHLSSMSEVVHVHVTYTWWFHFWLAFDFLLLAGARIGMLLVCSSFCFELLIHFKEFLSLVGVHFCVLTVHDAFLFGRWFIWEQPI